MNKVHTICAMTLPACATHSTTATQQMQNATNTSNMMGFVHDRLCCHGPRSPFSCSDFSYGWLQHPMACLLNRVCLAVSHPFCNIHRFEALAGR
jgi:hypothetical protein